jgi:excisionase family DNA binding protein
MDDGTVFLTIDEVAAELRTTPAALYASRHRGHGPRGVRIGRRLLFSREDITRWLESCREAST